MIYCKDCPWSGWEGDLIILAHKSDDSRCPRCGAVMTDWKPNYDLLGLVVDVILTVGRSGVILRDSFKDLEPTRGWDHDD